MCNYTLYQSLRQCQQHHEQQLQHGGRWQAVFVHVPSFAVIGQERQLAFATDLLRLLAAQPAAVAVTEDRGGGGSSGLQHAAAWLERQRVPALFVFLTTWFTLKAK